jgi:hypothetical protein
MKSKESSQSHFRMLSASHGHAGSDEHPVQKSVDGTFHFRALFHRNLTWLESRQVHLVDRATLIA